MNKILTGRRVFITFLILVAAFVLLILILIGWNHWKHQRAAQDVDKAIAETVELINLNAISKEASAPKTSCRSAMFFSTICETRVNVTTKPIAGYGNNTYPPDITSDSDMKVFLNQMNSELESEGWERGYGGDREIGFSYNKLFGSRWSGEIYCQASGHYSSIEEEREYDSLSMTDKPYLSVLIECRETL